MAVALVFVLGGELLGAHSAAAQFGLAASAFALLVLPVALPMLKPARARTTLPRTLATPTV